MKINKENLQEALMIVKPGLANKEILQQTTSFAFLKGRVTTYNDEISISHPVGDIDFEGAVKAEELYGLLSKLSQKTVDIEIKKEELRISSGRVKAGIQLQSKITLPLKEIPDKWNKIKEPERFKKLVTIAAQTCSADMSQPKLTCVSIQKDGTVIGSDGYRLVNCKLEQFPTKDFLIPASSVFELIKINPTHVQLEESWIHFKNKEGTYFSSRRVNDDYIDPEKIATILQVKKKKEIEFPSKVLDMLDRVSPFAKRDFTLDESIHVEIDGGKILLKAQKEDTKSWIKEKASIKCEESLSFIITPSLFRSILKETRKCILHKDMTKAKFTLKGEWDYIVMLRG
jgi:hypothetical protein